VTDGIRLTEIQALWQGSTTATIPVTRLIVSGNTKAVFEKLWGSASLSTVEVVSADDLLATAWEQQGAWAILPFEDLEAQWKVIAVDDQSPIQKAFDKDRYGLKIPFSLVGDAAKAEAFLQNYGPNSDQPLLPASNRDPNKLTTVALTGVTALVRGTAYLMEKNGMTYPAIDIGDTLRDVDILHVSNEIPFTETCPNPFANLANDANLVFCSKPEYIQLLEAIGTDVVEVTGDHFRDWGADAMLNTLDMYNERGWQYYGGGTDLADGMQPALFEHNGNKIAFVGCNAKPPGYATASATSPGAVHCDMDAMADIVEGLVADGYLPIFTFQHLEYYTYTVNENLIDDFEKAAAAGAVIVSGSQAHQPHAFAFYRGATLHYGLGNLFFDQYNEGFPQRQAFIDRHVFYDGRYISTELITMMFTDMARPRLMTSEERADLLSTVFNASGW
jgi:poly-gamma-glutamate synthesis protein (capsule biosynthesis protein)